MQTNVQVPAPTARELGLLRQRPRVPVNGASFWDFTTKTGKTMAQKD
jgi:hypothetical protein